MSKLWTKEEESFLIEMYEQYSSKDIASALEDRSTMAVKKKAQNLGLFKGHKKWSSLEIDILIDSYNTGVLIKDISKLLKNRSIDSIKGKACTLGIKNYRGFNPKRIGKVYLVYFPKYDIYKIGSTIKSIQSRLCYFPKFEIVFYIESNDIRKIEDRWLKNVEKYLIDEKCLPDGNTETFRF